MVKLINFKCTLLIGIIRKPDGSSGASSVKEASIGAKISSAEVPMAFSSTPLHSWNQKSKYDIQSQKVI